MKALLAVAIFFFAVATTITHTEESSVHRIIGTWAWTYEKNNCSEVYEFKSDRTSKVTSGKEILEIRFTISDHPDSNGFYRMTQVVTKSNGQTGCDGRSGGTPVGDASTIYIVFHRVMEKMLMCYSPSFNSCFGPLVRLTQ